MTPVLDHTEGMLAAGASCGFGMFFPKDIIDNMWDLNLVEKNAV